MALAIALYIKESGSPEGPLRLEKRLPGDFQSLEAVKGTAYQEKPPEDGYCLCGFYFLGKFSPL